MKRARDPRDLALVMLKSLTPGEHPRLGPLKDAGYLYIRDVADVPEAVLRGIEYVGDKTIDWLKRMLARIGLKLA
jgi:hypothetical protein